MTSNGAGNQTGARIHAIVLTRNRPETLQRCVATALSSLGTDDILTILDDSLPTVSPANASLLAATPRGPGPTRVHVQTLRARELLAKSLPMPLLLWLSKTAPRDIAPLRNLSLLLSTAVPAETTVLIDDDIHSFDLAGTHQRINALADLSVGVIAGADIGGIDERDIITRLTDAIDALDKLPLGAKNASIRDLFHAPEYTPSVMGSVVGYVSGGYLAFRLPRERLFAFPPGYNEDWLWCLLHRGNPRVRVFRTGETVIHDPPSVRRPTREDLFFELVGELMFDCLEAKPDAVDEEAALGGAVECLPGPALMPSARSQALLDKARRSDRKDAALSLLEEYGLTLLADMLRAGELQIDARQILVGWTADAIAKHRSVAATLRNEGAMPALKTLLREGRL